MAVTIRKIAEMAGVSVGTVDRALNDRGRIDPEVRRRVLDIARALEYAPNKAAKSLSARKRGLRLGFIVQEERGCIRDALISGANAAAAEISDSGAEVLVRECRTGSADELLRHADELAAAGVSGIAAAPADDGVPGPLAALLRTGVPVVLAGGSPSGTGCLCRVGQDGRLKGRIIANLLHLAGCTRLAVFTSPLRSSVREDVLAGLGESAAYPDVAAETFAGLSGGAVLRALSGLPEANAVLLADPDASGALRALGELREAGRRMLTVSAFFSPEIREAMRSGLVDAAVWCDQEAVGRRAVTALFDYLVGGVAPPPELFEEQRLSLRESIPPEPRAENV